MHITKVTSLQDYNNHVIKDSESLKTLNSINSKINEKIKTHKQFFIKGFSWTAQAESKFLVDLKFSNGIEVNLRDRLDCRITKLNNRTRGSIQIWETLFKPKRDDSIYVTEQSSALFSWMRKKYSNLTGSEYINNSTLYYKTKIALKLFPKKLNHQDLTQLSFDDNQFKFVLSFECFEHIPDYKKAIKEIFRSLKPNGKLLFTVPFDINNQKNLIRAVINNGVIEHLVEPEYHGDPVSNKGCLSYCTFGWQLLDDLRNIGFSHSYILLYWSQKYCNLGNQQIIICAEKS
ncbi:MAG: class I SAM-dependent methyltransferase [Marinicellaceae bacterium]